MSEKPDKESKTEEATPKKIDDAIEKGNTPTSREAGLFASMIGMILIFNFIMYSGSSHVATTLATFIDSPDAWRLQLGTDAVLLFSTIAREVLWLLAPFALILTALGIAGSVAQNPPRIVPTRIKPKLSNISIKSGWTRIFGKQAFMEFAKALFKFGTVSFIGLLILSSYKTSLLNALLSDPYTLPSMILSISNVMILYAAAAFIVLVIADVIWSRFKWMHDLRMTKQEVKDENKQTDGDPIVKTRMRSLARDRARKRMMAAVPQATLVIANPTHYAVALRYVKNQDAAPMVVAKGTDLIALKIREIAEANGVPVVEDKPLARSLYKAVTTDQPIPAEFYNAIAEIILFLMSRSPRLKSHMA